MKVTRRKLAAVVLVPATAALAQNPPPVPATPDQELTAARERSRQVAAALAEQTVPMTTEPAFSFKA